MLRLKSWERVTYTGDGFTVSMEVKRLGFIEEKAFSVHMSRVRRDQVVKHMLLATAEETARKRKVLTRMAGLLPAGATVVPLGDDLDAAYTAIEAQLREAGITEPPMTAAELEDVFGHDEERIASRQKAMTDYWESLDPVWLRQVFTDYVRAVEGLVIDDVPITTGAALAEVADQPLTLFVLETIRGLAGLSGAEKKASSSPHTSGPVAGPGESPVTSAAPEGGTALATVPEPQAAASSSA
jgi:hypothetical protein